MFDIREIAKKSPNEMTDNEIKYLWVAGAIDVLFGGDQTATNNWLAANKHTDIDELVWRAEEACNLH